MWRALIGLGLSLLLAGVSHSAVLASSAPVKLFISGTTLTLNGHASPNALVEIKKDGSIVGSVVADNTGYFSKYFSAFDSGLNTISVSYRDSFGTLSDTVTRTVNIRPQQNTSLYYYLPPTASISNKTIIEGNNQSVYGYTRPFATLKITLDGGASVLTPKADENGYYEITFSTKNYYTGRHIVSVQSTYENTSSPSTEYRTYTVSSNRPKIFSRELIPPSFTVNNPLVGSGSTTLTGLAPPNTQLIIYEDDVTQGSTFANSEGGWAFNLFVDQNSVIQVVACYGEDCSAKSEKLNILFEDLDELNCALDLALTNYRYYDQKPKQEITINITNLNGTPPFVVQVDWGDGETSELSIDSTNGQKISHIYDQVGQFNATVSVLDNQNCGGSKYFSAEVNNDRDYRFLLWLIPLSLIVLTSAYLKLRTKEIEEDLASENLDKI